MNSFTSSVSSLTTAKNSSGFADDPAAPSLPVIGNMTPSRGNDTSVDLSHGGPQTPREVQFHFQLDAAQCSPIPGIPEEDGDMSSKSAFSTRKNRSSGSHLCNSRDSGSNKSSRTSARPMPDMAAFDPDAFNSSRSEDSASTASRTHPPSPKLLCPPTPVRTPAWAHCNEPPGANSIFKPQPKYSRSNSLITTKVLATCPPQVLDGRASLENSALEEEHSPNTSRDTTSANSNTIPASVPVAPFATTEGAPEDNQCDWFHDARTKSTLMPPPAFGTPAVVSMATHFEVLSTLGRGNFADVFRVRSKVDGRLYAVKRNRRQFRGKRDREKALAEVKCMQNLQNVCAETGFAHPTYCLYLLFFYQAWQEDGHFFSQTELCCRDTCRELMDAVRSQWTQSQSLYPSLRDLEAAVDPTLVTPVDGRLFPEPSIWKICHDMSAGLSHIHSRGFVHFDIKPANIFFVPHGRYGAMCKIGDFGMAGETGSSEDGQEGDQKYMAPELLSSDKKHPSADIFSLGLTLYELASSLSFFLPSEGSRWHEIRSGHHQLVVPPTRDSDLLALIQTTLHPTREKRPTAQGILAISKVASAGSTCDNFLRDYIHDIENFDRSEELRSATKQNQTPRIQSKSGRACSPAVTRKFAPSVPLIYSPEAASS